ncbi:MAG: squalene/phytoene synthase family protein [Alphaproteobacteria bacterium]|nr:squalene/phytoene synthase family protein [Alphaproteobacteria bacterium]
MDEVSALVRQQDRDRYLASLFAPEAKRPHLLALYAFSAEISRIASQVSEPHLAEIRLQWWMDTIDGLYHGDAQAHPVAQALGRAIVEGDIPKHALMNLAKAHQFDFYSDAMPSLHDLEAYLGETASSLIQMTAMVLDKDAALECQEASGLAGVAYGMGRLFNALPLAMRLRQGFLPLELLAQRGVLPDKVAEPEQEAAVGVVLADLRLRAQDRLAQLRRVTFTIKPPVAPAFLHVALAEAYLARAARLGAGMLTRGCDISQLRKQWLLWKAAKSEEF